jgi:hypothetical protein
MTNPEPAKSSPSRSELLTFFRWVLSSWQRVLRVVVLIAAPIVGVLIFAGIAVTAVFYLKVDPQRWGAVLGLGVIAAGVARAVVSVRAWLDRHRTSSSAELPPAGTQQIAGPEGEPGPAGDGNGDDDVSN